MLRTQKLRAQDILLALARITRLHDLAFDLQMIDIR